MANSFSVFKYGKTDQSITGLNKITGLSGTRVSCFECSYEHNLCFIGYSDGNLDIIRSNNTIQNQAAILNSSILGDKIINNVLFIDDKAYLSTGLGIVIMELESFNVLEYVSLKEQDDLVQFQELFLHDQSLFAVTNQGLRSVPLAEVSDFNAPWKSYSVPSNVNALEHFFADDQNLYVIHKTGIFNNDTVLIQDGDSFTPTTILTGIGINSIKKYGDSLIITQGTSINLYNLNYELQSTIFTFNSDGGMLPQASMFTKDQQVLVADRVWGGVLTSFENQFNSEFISSTSPNSADIGNVTIIDGTVYAFASGNEFTFNQPLLHVLEDNEWSSYNIDPGGTYGLRNLTEIVSTDDGLFVATDATGLIQISETFEPVENFVANNSNIQDAQPDSDYDYLGLTDMVKDDDGNLWIFNHIVPEPLVVRFTDGSWASIELDEVSPKTNELIQLSNGYLVAILIGKGILIYDHNDTPENFLDDRSYNLTSNPTNGNLPSNLVTSIAEDNDGELWIGTDAGVAVVYNPESVFESNFEGAQRIIVNQEGYNGYLLETELVDAIAVDGADRKWIGTSTSGVFLVSSDGTRQIQHFTTDNSPLLSDKIVDLEVHPTTGEVFITSESGLISYRSDATESNADLENMTIFPNPVRPEFSGEIAITNLFDGTRVRITNAAGELISETVSLGGQATWNATDVAGNRVSSGVYLVFAVKPDGTQGKAGKILVLSQ